MSISRLRSPFFSAVSLSMRIVVVEVSSGLVDVDDIYFRVGGSCRHVDTRSRSCHFTLECLFRAKRENLHTT